MDHLTKCGFLPEGTCPKKPDGMMNSLWYPSGKHTKLAIEAMTNLWLIYPLKMLISHSYVSLPEGNFQQLAI